MMAMMKEKGGSSSMMEKGKGKMDQKMGEMKSSRQSRRPSRRMPPRHLRHGRGGFALAFGPGWYSPIA